MAAFVLDYFDDSINTPEHLEALTTIPTIGLIPAFPTRLKVVPKRQVLSVTKLKSSSKSDTWLICDPQSQVAEAYRTLRTSLMMSRAEHHPKVIAVVSGSPQEGKSTTCFNTAAAFAIQGSRVLYLDADMRRPVESRTFECSNETGLTNYLTSMRPVAEVIHQSSEIDTLFITPAGAAPPNPSELIGSRRFANLITDLKLQFDYIFIDTPPLLFVSDSQLLSSHSDGYLLVLRAGKTTKRVFWRTLSAVTCWKSSPLGVVLNGVDTRSAEYAMYGYYQGQRSYYAAKAS
jgi:succinoglycan biosynthesis transport protein ExoP